MKLRPVLLAFSVAANAALLFVYVKNSPRWSAYLPGAASAASDQTPRAATKVPEPRAERFDPKTWTTLTAGDLSAIAARLQAEGFPPSLRRSIVGALVAQKMADRHHALAELIRAQPWWVANGIMSASVIAARQQLSRDEKEMTDQLMGAEAPTTDYAHARQIQQFGKLPDAKLAELNRITSDYDELINQVRQAAQYILLPEDREKIAYLEKEKRADIEKTLTPEELFEYDLRSSPTATSLRNQLVAFNPSEEEFRALFKVQQAFDSQFGSGNQDLMTTEQRRARLEAQKQLLSQVQSVLPPDRYADYQQKTDPLYLQANAVTTRLGLPATAAGDIVAVQKDITKRANQIRGDASLSPEQRNVQLSALGSEAVLRLTPTLGDAGLAAYRQSGGYWLNQLQRPPTPPAPATPGKR